MKRVSKTVKSYRRFRIYAFSFGAQKPRKTAILTVFYGVFRKLSTHNMSYTTNKRAGTKRGSQLHDVSSNNRPERSRSRPNNVGRR